MRRFPLHTLLLMALALAAFARLYYMTHQPGRPAGPASKPPSQTGTAGGASACRTLEQALEGVVRAPEDPIALARAQGQLAACNPLPARACELGAALDARAPLESGMTPPRALLAALCERCPAGANPCASQVSRALLGVLAGAPANAARLTWHLEHAGAATPEACAEVVRQLLVPAALAPTPLTSPRRELVAPLAALCGRAGQLPANVLHAAVVQGEVPALAELVGEPRGEAGPVLQPDRLVGPAGGDKAFDGQESTGLELKAAPQAPRWQKDGALSAVFEPPVRRLSALRVRARGAGSLRAAVRLERAMGLQDPDAKTAFVLPVVCRFRGTGSWEDCALPVSLLDVEALSVFPEPGPLTLGDVEARGTR